MSQRPGAKLEDVARAAGVSLSTASRALTDTPLVRADTRQRVRDAASLLGYVPHGAARALATQRSGTIGAVFPPIDNPIFASATQALSHELATAGYTLLLATHEYDPAAETAAIRALLQRGVDGLALVGLHHEPALYQLLERSGVPFELTWSLDPSGFHHSVGIAHRAASARITQHLLDLGHREFAVIAGVIAHNDRLRERLAGVRDALAARNIALPDARIVEAPFEIRAGRRALNTLLARAGGFSAVICGNDVLAVGALLECTSLGIAVPAEMSIVGFDDIELAGEIAPGLTTIRVPSAEIGRLSARRLLARLRGEAVPPVQEVGTELIVRGTTGAVRAGQT